MKKGLIVILMLLLITSMVVAKGQSEKSIKIGATILHVDQFANVLANGYKTKAKELGVDIMVSNSELSLDKEAETIYNFIEAGVDALIIEPVSPLASATIAELAISKGIPVFACAIPIYSDKIFASSINDNIDLGSSTGKATAKWLEERYGKNKSIKCAVGTFDSSDPEGSQARLQGFQQELTDFNIDYVARQDVIGDKGFEVFTDVLTQHPDLDIIFCNFEVGLVAAYNAIVAAGKVGDIHVFGIDASAQICDMMLSEDVIQIATAQAPYEQGMYAVETMYNYLAKGIVPEVQQMKMPSILIERSNVEGINEFRTNWLERAK